MGLQRVTRAYSVLQGVRGGYRGLQRLQVVTGGYKELQKVARGNWGLIVVREG